MSNRQESAGNPPIYQLKLTLLHVAPPVWRRILVRSDVTLKRLHMILQRVMGWENSHMYQFVVGKTHYGMPDPELETKNDSGVHIDQALPKEKSKLVYQYDFGDGWQHELLLEKVLPADQDRPAASCVEGARACPPEDCGGAGGYEDFLAAIGDPKHEQHEDMLDWIGGGFDPEAFSVDQVNRRLRLLQRQPKAERLRA